VAREREGRDPWARSPVGELSEPLLPRWFVLTAIVMVPVAVAAVAGAFLVYRSGETGVAERRPPPAGDLTAAVGDLAVGEAEPVDLDAACPAVEGFQVAGAARDLEVLTIGINALCAADLDGDTAERVERLADNATVVRFAVFEATGVDVATDTGAVPRTILVNARFTQTDPGWIAPLVALEATFVDEDPAAAEGALAARRAEAGVCADLFTDTRPSRACEDAAALIDLPDPAAALREVGYR
jgi:hypothetical protein